MKPSQSELTKLFSLDFRSGRLFKRLNGKTADPVSPLGYRRTYVYGRRYQTHQLIWIYLYGLLPDKMQVDHIDGNRSNNRPSNLRLVSFSAQRKNSALSSKNTSGVTGVSFSRRHNLWRARLTHNYKEISLGWFKTKKEAVKARKAIAIRYGFHQNHGTRPPGYSLKLSSNNIPRAV